MKGLILDKEVQFYSSFFKVFNNIKALSEDYNWLITDMEYAQQSYLLTENSMEQYCWVSGRELKNVIVKEGIQWIWGVFSGFNKNISLEDILKYDFPIADGYEGFWKNPISIQHPLAEVELVAWDSCCSLFISKSDIIIEDIRALHPLAVDLEVYNSNGL